MQLFVMQATLAALNPNSLQRCNSGPALIPTTMAPIRRIASISAQVS